MHGAGAESWKAASGSAPRKKDKMTEKISFFKGIVSRDFDGLQMILVNRTGVPDVPLEVYSF